MACGDVKIESPPPVPKSTPGNPLTRLLPVVMLVAAVGMMAVYYRSGGSGTRNPMFMLFPVMMLTSVLGTLVYGARGAGHTSEINHDRGRYLRYLDTVEAAAAHTAADQYRSLRCSHPDPHTLWTMVGGSRMWERRPDDPDFCHVRIGCGDQPLSTALVMPDLRDVQEADPVTAAAVRGLVQRCSVVPDVPVALNLRDCSVVTVGGEVDAARALVRAMVCQLALAHAPDVLAIVAAPDDEWEWLKWLPHHRHSGDDGDVARVVVVLDGAPTAIVERGSAVTVIEVGTTLDGVATTHGSRIWVEADGVTAVRQDDATMRARPDSMTRIAALVCARRLAAYRASDISRSSTAPIRWLDLMGFADVDRIDFDRQWATDGARRILPVPIGVSDDGAAVTLDINEAARNGMGPHGLCVGATGSGKSELLRTLALGMIAAHPPDALNLVLVDFKGGATFLGLDRARHVAALITNLAEEAHLVSRMNDALAGEMNRRQQQLRSAGRFANVAEYEQARSRGATLPALPTMFIVVDEFSEMLTQHPDFAELFLAIGRQGRSLGMHLLLASQRLDEGRLRGLETHLSYRICLKTFSASESRAVLGVPDAYHLPSTPGAAFLKTASGEVTRFQTAFVSGPDDGARRGGAIAQATSRRPVLFTAAPVPEPNGRGDVSDVADASTRTLLDSVLDRVAGRGDPAHRVWLPPLADSPTLDTLGKVGARDELTVSIGLVDNPFEQRRDLLTAELGGAAGNVAIVGGPRSGKSMAVRTLLLALAERHDPADVGLYCLDFGGGALASLRELPHVGSVASGVDVDLCRRTVAVISSVIRKRERRFRELGIDSIDDYRLLRAAGDPKADGDPFGDVFLVIDGWAVLRQEFDNLEAAITAIAAQGLSFGVHVIVTATRWAELRPALKDQIATRIELRLGDPAESEMDRRCARQSANRPAGRGITADGRESVIALPRWDGRPTADGLAEAIAANAQRLCDRWGTRQAPTVELLPTRLDYLDLVTRFPQPEQNVTIGLGERELLPLSVDFARQSHLLVLGEAHCGKTSVLRLLCRELIRTTAAHQTQLEIVDYRRTLLGVVDSDHLCGYAMSPAVLASRMRVLLELLTSRMPDEGVTQRQLRDRSWWSGPEVYLVIDDYDLVAAATGNPLTPLADFLPHAEDLGLHVIVARRSGGAARAMFDPLLARLRELGCGGLMMSASPDEGVLLGSVRPSQLPPGRGTLVTRDDEQLVQVAWTEPL